MATTRLYTEKENGDLKLVAEVGIDDPALAVDALLDENPRLKNTEYVAINEDQLVRVEVPEEPEIVQPRRRLKVKGGTNGATAAEDKPTRRRKASTRESTASKAAPATRSKPGPKPGAKTNKDGSPRSKPGPKPKSAASKPGPKPKAKAATKPKTRAKSSSPFKMTDDE